ncbi:MAG: hypothetical protein IJC86_00970 [Clostridia bacterium]|nr:hypothetical protein [Clostridia bacterium]
MLKINYYYLQLVWFYPYDNKQMISFVSTENGTYTFELQRMTTTSNTIIDYSLAYSVR